MSSESKLFESILKTNNSAKTYQKMIYIKLKKIMHVRPTFHLFYVTWLTLSAASGAMKVQYCEVMWLREVWWLIE